VVSIPQLVPGIVSTLFAPLAREAAMSSGVATSSSVRSIVDKTATSAAAGVAEGGTKPKSTIGLSTVDEAVKKIATLLPVFR
jgi:hypothetical protein